MTQERSLEANWSRAYSSTQRPFVTVLDRLIATDVLKTLTSVWSVLVVIIVSKKFIKVLEKAIEGQVSQETLLKILGLKTLVASVEFLPAALFMAILMVLGRMYRDQEMAAISSAGGGSFNIYRAVYLLVLPLTLIGAGMSLYAAPWAENRIDQLMAQDEQSADIRGIAAGKFSEYSHGDLVFYVEKIAPDKEMHKVFVQQRDHGELKIINAQTARFKDLDDGRYVVFQNGERVLGIPGRVDYVIEEFKEYGVRIEEKDFSPRFNRAAQPTSLLLTSPVKHDRAELQRRLSIPLGMLLLSFLAVPLAQVSPRGGVYGNIATGFLIYFSYGNLLRASQAWVVKGSLTALQSGTITNILLLAIGAILLARLYGFRWLKQQFFSKEYR